jgi:hypothetical protein
MFKGNLECDIISAGPWSSSSPYERMQPSHKLPNKAKKNIAVNGPKKIPKNAKKIA